MKQSMKQSMKQNVIKSGMKKVIPFIKLMQYQKKSDNNITKSNQNDELKQLDLDTKYHSQMDQMD